MSDYAPSVNAVRESYAGVRHPEVGTVRAYEEFDRWLAAERRKAKAEALREAADNFYKWHEYGYRAVVMCATENYLRARAAELEGDDRDDPRD